MKNLKESRLGTTWVTNSGHVCKVVDYENSNNTYVQFNCGLILKVRWSHLVRGEIKYPSKLSNCGVGFIGVGGHNSITSKEAYSTWDQMLTRCYRGICKGYENCVVHEHWLNFQKFADWYYSQNDWDKKDCKGKSYCLDKDILGDGKIYSEQTCCFVPESLNKFLTNTKSATGAYRQGKKFLVRTRLSGVVGIFEDKTIAMLKYKETKLKDLEIILQKENYENQNIIKRLRGKFT